MLVCFKNAENAFTNSFEEKGIVLYLYDSRKFDDIRKYRGYLSESEKIRAGKFIREQDARVYTLTHALLRLQLAKIFDLKLIDISFSKGEFGKPCLSSLPYDFNLSHSKNFFSILISTQINTKVGVDLEEYKSITELDGIVENYMHPEEAVEINRNRKSFFTYWTRKEALLKLTGLGLVNDLQAINTTNGTRDIFLKEETDFGLQQHSQVKTYLKDQFALSFALSNQG